MSDASRHRDPQWAGRQRLLVGAAALLVFGAIGAAGVMGFGFLASGTANIDPNDPAQVALGRRIYAEHCASCHGARLEGELNWRERKPDGRLPAPPHDASGHTWHHPDGILFDITKEGIAALAPPGYRSDMPAFGGTLTDDEIRAVLAFIKSTWPSEIQTRQAAIAR